MPREIFGDEVQRFKTEHPEIAIKLTAYSSIPPWGIAVKDKLAFGFTRYVLVWKDAAGRWRFIDLRDMPNFAAEVNKPAYHTPDESLLNNILERAGMLADKLPQAGMNLSIVALAIVVGVLLLKR